MYPDEDRQWALYVLSETGTFSEAARVTGVSRNTIARWAREDGTVSTSRKGIVLHTTAEKLAALAMLDAGTGAREVADAFDVTPQTVGNWRRRMEEGELKPGTPDERARAPQEPPQGPAAPPAEAPEEDIDSLRKRIHALELKNAVLEQKIEILKKDPSADVSDMGNREKAMVVGALRNVFSLSELLCELGLSRSTYYYERRALARGDRLAWLRPLVTSVFAQSHGIFGSERVWARIRELGIIVSEKVVRKVMRECGLIAKTSAKGRRYSSYEGEEGRACAPNLLLLDRAEDAHEFRCPVPGKVFSTDVTEFKLPSGSKVYLSPMIDLFDGKVISAAIGQSPNKELVAGMLADASPSFVGTVVVHNDRGWHYRTPDWISQCEELGVVRSMSRKGHSPDNAVSEALCA